jgi:putative ABC transport system permease protein
LAGVGLYFAARVDAGTSDMMSSIRGITRQLDPQAIVEHVAPMEQLVSNSIGRPRLYAVLLGIFSSVAVVLAAIGVYGVMAHSVTRRTREIGIRMALGAQPWAVVRLMLRRSLALTAAGMLLGLAGAFAVTHLLDQLLFGITSLDPATFVVGLGFFGVVAALATFVPARRATQVDPLIALRSE